MSPRLRCALPALVLLAACGGSSDDDAALTDEPPPDDGSETGTTDGIGTGTGTDDPGAGSDTAADGDGNGGTDSLGGSIIGVENYESVLRELVDVIGSERFETVHLRLLALVEPLRNDRQATSIDGLTFVREERIELDSGRFNNRSEYACENGGTLAYNSLPAGVDYELGDCEVDGVVRDGAVRSVFAREQGTHAYERFGERGFEGGDIALDGRRASGDYSRSFDARFAWIVNDYRQESADGVTIVSEASFESLVALAAPPPSSRPPPSEEYARSLSVAFTVSAPWSGGESVTVSTGETPFGDFTPPGVYTTGALVVNAPSDGSGLVLDADSGAAESALVTVTEAGVTTSFSVPWSEIGTLACLTPRGESPDTYGCRPR